MVIFRMLYLIPVFLFFIAGCFAFVGAWFFGMSHGPNGRAEALEILRYAKIIAVIAIISVIIPVWKYKKRKTDFQEKGSDM